MNSKKLMGMAMVLVVLAGIAWIQNKQAKKRHAAQLEDSETLFHGLELNQVDGVEITANDKAAVLAKKDGRWVVESLFDYPADFKKLADALRSASEVRMGAPVRAANVDPSEYGLDRAKTIRLKSAGQEAVEIGVGARREASSTAGWANQHFIRKDGGGEIYLVDYDFRSFASEPEEWIDTELINVPSSEIVSVKVGNVELQLEEDEWTLADLDGETEELQSTEANKLRMALQYLNCTDVADPAASDADLGFTNTVVYTASTTNKSYTVTVGGENDDGRYVRFSGDVPAKLSGWTYVISTYEAGDFLITRDRLVKARELEEEAPAE
jgi:hypothetical protein